MALLPLHVDGGFTLSELFKLFEEPLVLAVEKSFRMQNPVQVIAGKDVQRLPHGGHPRRLRPQAMLERIHARLEFTGRGRRTGGCLAVGAVGRRHRLCGLSADQAHGGYSVYEAGETVETNATLFLRQMRQVKRTRHFFRTQLVPALAP
jgi:hypothetical protein